MKETNSKSFVSLIFDTLGVLVLIFVSLGIGSYSLAKKVHNERKLYNTNGIGIVNKEKVSIVSKTRGVITDVKVKTGQLVSVGDVLITIDNPLLKETIIAYEKYPDNLSAKTQAEVARKELEYLNVVSPVNGVVGDVFVAESQSIQDLGSVMEIYSNDSVEVESELTPEQFVSLSKESSARANIPRLNKEVQLKLERTNPELRKTGIDDPKKIVQTFTLEDSTLNKSLLQDEEIEIIIPKNNNELIKPVDYIVNSWARILKWEE